MRLLEHQAKTILASWGVPVPRSALVQKPSQLTAALKSVGSYPAVLKAQVYAGGRGKAGGIVKVNSISEAREATSRLLGKRLVTHQSGKAGVLVCGLLVEQGVTPLQEFYLSILIDRSKQLPMVVASREGGVSIEETAASRPEAILTTPFDPLLGLYPYQARRIIKGLKLPKEHQAAAVQQLLSLSRGFFSSDASLIEINPWALTKELGLVALDAKLTLDDNGLFRHPEWAERKTEDADSPIEAQAREIGISYVGLDGTVGCMVNGAGLAMATMDLIKLHGGEPANFLDVGGGADVHQVREAFKLILADSKVKSVLINIFGGIMKCDVIAQGIIEAASAIKVQVPLVIRLEGTNVGEGRKLLEQSKLGLITAAGMDEAAEKAVEATR